MESIFEHKSLLKKVLYSPVKHLLVILFLAQTFFLPNSAKSDNLEVSHDVHLFRIRYDRLGTGIGLAVSVIAVGGGLTSICANSIYLKKNKELHLAWRIIGYSFSGLNLGALILWNGIHNKGDDYNSWSKTLVPAHAAIAILDLGLTVWASRTPDKVEQKLSIQPTLMTDSKHQPVVVVSINFLKF